MAAGSRELTRRATAHLVGVAFALTYLVASFAGASVGTSLVRGCIVAGVTMVLGALLCRPVIDVVLDAAARDEAKRAAEQAKDGDA